MTGAATAPWCEDSLVRRDRRRRLPGKPYGRHPWRAIVGISRATLTRCADCGQPRRGVSHLASLRMPR